MKNNFLFFVGQLSLWMVNLCLKYYTFCPLFYPIFTCMEPDPYWEYGSTKLLNMDPIRIRIHNTACRVKYSILVVPYFPSWFLFPQNCCRGLLVTEWLSLCIALHKEIKCLKIHKLRYSFRIYDTMSYKIMGNGIQIMGIKIMQ